MSRLYEATVTLTVDGDDRDVEVRAHVSYGGGSIDGDVEALISGEWRSLDTLVLDAHDRERAEDALCDACSEDDSDQDCGDYERDRQQEEWA